jgi:regulator of sigma E protease
MLTHGIGFGVIGSIVARIAVFSAMVFFHELGHYLAARWRGVYVEAFSIGFGPALLAWTDKLGTVWKISAIPLGGYVKMYGMSASVLDEVGVDRAAFREGEAYFQKSVGSRAIVAVAGPVANFVLAFVLFTAVAAIQGRQTLLPDPVAGRVHAGGAADLAGVRDGDRFISINGAPVPSFDALRTMVMADAGKTEAFVLRRGDQDLNLTIAIPAHASAGLLGVEAVSRTQPVSLPSAIVTGASETWGTASQIVVGLYHLLSTGRGLHELGGPIRIVQVTGEVAQFGLAALVSLTALLSVNLGIVNLLPIPILDGGHLLLYFIEYLRGRPVSQRAQEYGFRVGFAIIATIFIFTSWNDLISIGAFRWMARLVG